MKKLFMATKNGVSEVQIIKEDENCYYVEEPFKNDVRKDLKVICHDFDDNVYCYGTTDQEARNRFDSYIEENIRVHEIKIARLRKKLI